ncbi:exonuclease domain-containing protein [Herbiconiux sp. P15]|uniref:exonuclease domain-containing protein n=1 Tax=Herbiconiux liukaitaii TaxID=3342799 RepID=UPI0035BB44DB
MPKAETSRSDVFVELPLFDLVDAELVVEQAAAAPFAAPIAAPEVPAVQASPAVAEVPAEPAPRPRPAWADRLVVFDLETTGIDVETSRVVTANISRLDAAGEPIQRHDWLADPGVEIPEQATAVHGITTARARAEGRSSAEVIAEIVTELRRALDDGYALVVYNAPYDLTLLHHESRRHGVLPLVAPSPVIDPLVIDKQLDRYRKGKRTLEASSGHYGVSLTDAHDAGADAIAAGRVAQALASAFPAELDLPLAELHDAQHAWHDAQCDSFEDYMRRVRDPLFTARRGWPEVPPRA